VSSDGVDFVLVDVLWGVVKVTVALICCVLPVTVGALVDGGVSVAAEGSIE